MAPIVEVDPCNAISGNEGLWRPYYIIKEGYWASSIIHLRHVPSEHNAEADACKIWCERKFRSHSSFRLREFSSHVSFKFRLACKSCNIGHNCNLLPSFPTWDCLLSICALLIAHNDCITIIDYLFPSLLVISNRFHLAHEW